VGKQRLISAGDGGMLHPYNTLNILVYIFFMETA